MYILDGTSNDLGAFSKQIHPGIDPNNEDAILMLMKISLEKSNFSKVKDLSKTFEKVCKKLCDENQEVIKMLENLEPKNES